ncbi:biotin--[acetyl-CoA-carboxylase] ligase [Halomonas garicola]|uniref:biotin--[acetyl-CoA-carboxylase] ligase n=1 Tax=Halomonas garicola TaxID=1690008 RepID=UPI002896ABE9|nr:biotin--[acetyl-CoA-carboxylase] ligase [Halomonas garicola]
MTIGNLMRLLSDGEVHSGEQLGKALGISRAAVWKQLKKLETAGVEVSAVKGRGYQLAQPLTPLDGARIVAHLPADARRRLARLFVEDTLPSSNEYLRRRFSQGAGHGEVCLVEQQSAGRGRRGRAWLTPWGQSLMLSVGWRFDSGVAALEGLSLAIGVVVAEVLERYGARPQLKWPNDILLATPDGSLAKLAGILVEVTGDAAGPCDVVLGVGMNLALPETLRKAIGQPVAVLADACPDIDRNALAADVVAGLLAMLATFESEGFGAWRGEWNRRHAYAGHSVDVLVGNAQSVAVAGEVDSAGNLWVSEGGTERALAGGEISVRGRP